MILRFLKAFLLHFSFYLVIPLVGWVLGGQTPLFSALGQDLSAFFQQPARLAFAALALAAAVARGVIAARLPLPAHSVTSLSELQRWRNISLESILVLTPFSDARGLLVWEQIAALRWLGAALFALGMGLVLYATLVVIRHEKAMLPPPAPALLLTSGPYRHVRYPIQLGMLVVGLGLALLFRSWIGLVMLIFMLNYTLMQIRATEKWMPQKFGLQWAAYAKKTRRLFPGLY